MKPPLNSMQILKGCQSVKMPNKKINENIAYGYCWVRNEYLVLCCNVNRVLFLWFYSFEVFHNKGVYVFRGREIVKDRRERCAFLKEIYFDYLSQAKAKVIWFIVKVKSKPNWFIFRFCHSPLHFVICRSLCVITPTAYAKQ